MPAPQHPNERPPDATAGDTGAPDPPAPAPDATLDLPAAPAPDATLDQTPEPAWRPAPRRSRPKQIVIDGAPGGPRTVIDPTAADRPTLVGGFSETAAPVVVDSGTTELPTLDPGPGASEAPTLLGGATEAPRVVIGGAATPAPPHEATLGYSGAPAPDDATIGYDGAPTPDGASLTVPTAWTGGPPAAPEGGTVVGRYALRDLHARGGLGEVFLARDTELNRDVALKRIQSHKADDPVSRARFLAEARITAKLDHPGVVPVFGLVADVRGRPCYAMRFVHGETLKDEIDRYHAPPAPGAAPAVPQTVAFRALLSRFIATCQAVAYAHSRGVVHRDLKPANVMVGTFGETLVVDWGLAKVLGDRGEPNPEHAPAGTGDVAGSAAGTPSYMPPEQANGDWTNVGPRADIFALGATLYTILTGRPPLTGTNSREVLEKARRAAFPPPREVRPDCPAPLDAVCRKALAARPEARYATALELAADVERWLSDEPVSCHRDPPAARLARWARRHPARVAAGVSLLVAGALAAGGIAFAVNEGRKGTQAALERETAAKLETVAALVQVRAEQEKTAAALEQVSAEQRRTEEQRRIAVGLRDAAAGRYEGAVAAYNTLVHDIDRKLRDRGGMQDVRKRLLLEATNGLNALIAGAGAGKAGADRTLVAAHRQMGEVYQLVGDTARARGAFERAVAVARDVQGQALPDDRRAADRDFARSLERLAGAHLSAGDTKAALAAIEGAVGAFERLAADPGDAQAQQDLAAARQQRAKILMEQGKTSRAVGDCGAAAAACRALAEQAPADADRRAALGDALDLLAGAYLRTGRTADALAAAGEALAAREAVARARPDDPDAARARAAARARLGDVRFERAEMTAAAAEYAAARDLLTALAEPDEADEDQNVSVRADLALMLGRLAAARLRTGDVTDAVASARAGRDLALRLATKDEGSARARRDLALARERLGEALLALDRPDDALAEFAECERLLGPLRAADPASAGARLDLARGLERLGDGHMAKGDAAEAALRFAASVKAREEVAAGDGASATAKRDLALGLFKLAGAHTATHRRARADATAARAAELFAQLAQRDRDSGQAQRDLALAYGQWGHVLAATGFHTGALLVWQAALDRCERLTARDAGNVQAKEDAAAAWGRLAGFHAARGNTEPAYEAARRAVALWLEVAGTARTKADRRRLALAMASCGDLNAELRRFAEAREWYKRAAAEVAGAPAGDPVLGPVARRVADRQLYAEAVEAGLRNPRAVLEYPEGVRPEALRLVATLELRAEHPVTAASAATLLAGCARTADDRFAAARVFAGCTASPRVPEKTKPAYAADAVAQLRAAARAGFRTPEALDAPEWEAVRKADPGFGAARKELEELSAEK